MGSGGTRSQSGADSCHAETRGATIRSQVVAGISYAASVTRQGPILPVISPVERPKGFFLAKGFSGYGFSIGPAAGRLAADLVAGDAPVVGPYPYRYARPGDGTDLGAPGMF